MVALNQPTVLQLKSERFPSSTYQAIEMALSFDLVNNSTSLQDPFQSLIVASKELVKCIVTWLFYIRNELE